MEKTCGATRVVINAGSAPDSASLAFMHSDGSTTKAPTPDGLSDYVPVGLACVRGNDGQDYVVVQYGEAGGGCSFCEWFALFDAKGTPLTRHQPAILENPDMPPARRQSPNNAEYEAAVARLGITHPEIDYAP